MTRFSFFEDQKIRVAWDEQQEKLKQADMEKLFAEIEMPLTRVLHDMEMEGSFAGTE